jgi:type I restriction enzyme, S subunit
MEVAAEITAAVKNVPALRFPEFEGEWVENKFEDLCTLQRGFDLTNSTRVDGKIPVYSSSGLSYYHNVAKVKGPGVVTGRKGIVGKVYFIEEDFWPHDTSLWVKDFHFNSEKFVYYFLLRFRLERFDASTSVPTLNRNNVHGIKIKHPNLTEQQKIASFLSAADDKIQQLSKKKALLEKYKKGVMQQLFSQQIRFKDDNGNDYPEWEEEKLGTIVEVKKGEQLNKIELTESCQYPCINGGITPSGYTDKYNSEKDTITVSEGGNSCGFVNIIRTDFWSGGHCYTLKAKNQSTIENEYLYQLLKYNEAKIMKLRVGSGLPNIQKKDIISFKMLIPTSYDEQIKISEFLTYIDNKINYTSTQLEQAKKFKKGLLQQMFV